MSSARAPEAVGESPPASGSRPRWLGLHVTSWREILLVLGLLFCYGFFQQVPAWNEYSRYDLVRAIVENGTTQIDPFAGNTGDKAFKDGHYYSDKAPGTAFIGVPVYAALRAASGATSGGALAPERVVADLAFVASGLLTAFLGLLLFRFLRPVTGDGWALVVSVGYGLGSIAFPFATLYFGHAAAAFFLFATFYALWRARTAAGRRRGWLALLAGFLAGWAVLADVSCAFGVLVLLVYALLAGPFARVVRRPAGALSEGPGSVRPAGRVSRALASVDPRTPALVVLGAVPTALLLAWYDWASFGSPFSLGYTNLTSGGFAAGMGQGILGVTLPKLDVLVELLVGPRGLLRLAPWFVLVPAGLLAARRRDLRPEVVTCAAIAVAFLVFNAGYYLPFGGWTPGPRFLMPALPFAAVLVGLAPARVRPLTALLVGISVGLVFIATTTMPNAPEAYADPYRDLWLPRFMGGDLALTWTWLDWGIPAVGTMGILILGIVLAEAGLVATFGSGRLARAVTGASAAGLVALVLLFSVPFAPMAGVVEAATAPSGAGLVIADAGATPVTADGRSTARLWARVQNDGPPVADTRIVFTVHTAPGASWSGWVAGVAWSSHDHKAAAVVWDAGGEKPGDYPFDVRVTSGDGATVYAETPSAGVIHVGP